jgi:hypothetical protein
MWVIGYPRVPHTHKFWQKVLSFSSMQHRLKLMSSHNSSICSTKTTDYTNKENKVNSKHVNATKYSAFFYGLQPLRGYSGTRVNGYGYLVPIPAPAVPDGCNFFPIYIPVGTKFYPNPAPNMVFTRRVMGNGYPLTSLVVTINFVTNHWGWVGPGSC